MRWRAACVTIGVADANIIRPKEDIPMTDNNMIPENNDELIDDVVVMTDDEGNEYVYDIACRIPRDEDEYVVLVPQDEEDDEVVILKSVIIDDETEELVDVEDEDLLLSIFEEAKAIFEDEDDDDAFVEAE